MSLILTPHGEQRLLRNILAPSQSAWIAVGLYVNNYTPTRDSVMADITPMASSANYTLHAFTASLLTHVAGSTNPTVLEYPPIIWTWNTVPATPNVYGWYMTDGTGNLIGAERFTQAPFVLALVGDKITVDVKFRIKDEGDEGGGSTWELLDSGELSWVKSAAEKEVGKQLTFEFFTNDFYPTDASVDGDFDICSDSNLRASYLFTVDPEMATNADRSTATLPEDIGTSYFFSGTLYGYRIRESSTGTLIAAQRFTNPLVIGVGETIRANPAFTLRKGAF